MGFSRINVVLTECIKMLTVCPTPGRKAIHVRYYHICVSKKEFSLASEGKDQLMFDFLLFNPGLGK